MHHALLVRSKTHQWHMCWHVFICDWRLTILSLVNQYIWVEETHTITIISIPTHKQLMYLNPIYEITIMQLINSFKLKQNTMISWLSNNIYMYFMWEYKLDIPSRILLLSHLNQLPHPFGWAIGPKVFAIQSEAVDLCCFQSSHKLPLKI